MRTSRDQEACGRRARTIFLTRRLRCWVSESWNSRLVCTYLPEPCFGSPHSPPLWPLPGKPSWAETLDIHITSSFFAFLAVTVVMPIESDSAKAGAP